MTDEPQDPRTVEELPDSVDYLDADDQAGAAEQAVVVLRALQQNWPQSSQGRHGMAHALVVRGAREKERTLVLAVAHQFARGFHVEVSRIGTYFVVKLFQRAGER